MPLTTKNEITLEKSPAYFISKSVPERVYKMNPKMKLIVVVRNPITRAISGMIKEMSTKIDNIIVFFRLYSSSNPKKEKYFYIKI